MRSIQKHSTHPHDKPCTNLTPQELKVAQMIHDHHASLGEPMTEAKYHQIKPHFEWLAGDCFKELNRAIQTRTFLLMGMN
jgi:hypothetical protein